MLLKEYVERILAERELRYMQMFNSAKEALEKAEVALREYKAMANEFRGTLSDQALTFMPRQETELRLRQHEGALEDLRQQRTERSRWWTGQTITVALAAVGAAVALVLHFT